MNITVKKHHLIYALVLSLVLFAGHRYSGLVPNNQWKAHRWASEACRREGLQETQCLMAFRLPQNASSEVAMFDVCLEHGEFRRIR